MSEARLILTCGLPGAGKTTLARQLAVDRSAVRLTKDEWLWALGSTPWDEPARETVEQELWRLAQEILRLGVSVVLDFGLWARIERDKMRSVARGLGVGVELHYLDMPADELWRRIAARNSEPPWDSHPIRPSDFDEWLRVFHAPDAAELALFDPPPVSTEPRPLPLAPNPQNLESTRVSDYLMLVYRRALASSDPAMLQLSFDASVIDRYRDDASYQVIRTETAGRVRKERVWALDVGIAPDGTVHASWGAIAESLPQSERDHWAAHAVATAALSENFLKMQMSPGSCFDDGDTRRWE